MLDSRGPEVGNVGSGFRMSSDFRSHCFQKKLKEIHFVLTNAAIVLGFENVAGVIWMTVLVRKEFCLYVGEVGRV